MITLRSRAFFIFRGLAFLSFVLLFTSASAQNRKAEFPGGKKARDKFIQDSMRPPFGTDINYVDVVIHARYNVMPNGKAVFVRVTRFEVFQLGAAFITVDTQKFVAEVKRLINSMPRHKPALKNNKAIKSSELVKLRYENPPELYGPVQENPMETQSNEPFLYVEEAAQFPGGQDSLQSFIRRNMKYPQEAMKQGIEGKVIVKFIVTKTGDISHPTVIKGHSALNQEALRLMSIMPDWKPGKQNGRFVDCYFTLPIKFVLQ